jgi:hypothetical protein
MVAWRRRRSSNALLNVPRRTSLPALGANRTSSYHGNYVSHTNSMQSHTIFTYHILFNSRPIIDHISYILYIFIFCYSLMTVIRILNNFLYFNHFFSYITDETLFHFD